MHPTAATAFSKSLAPQKGSWTTRPQWHLATLLPGLSPTRAAQIEPPDVRQVTRRLKKEGKCASDSGELASRASKKCCLEAMSRQLDFEGEGNES